MTPEQLAELDRRTALLRKECDALRLAVRKSPDDLRARDWVVAVHNDYRLDGVAMTFWLFTHAASGRFVKGEGLTDADALDQCRAAASAFHELCKARP